MAAKPPFTVDYPRATDTPLRSIQRVYERLNALQQDAMDVSRTPLSAPQEVQVKSLIGPIAQQSLSVGGSNPLVINQIVGGNSLAQLAAGTHADRLAGHSSILPFFGNILNFLLGAGQPALYFETDRTVYYQYIGGTWKYTAGKMSAALASLPADLATADTGFIFYSTDYQHVYVWSGAAWSYAPGDEGSGRIEYFTVTPRAGRWQKLDGSAGITESLANGTTALVAFSGLAAGTVPDLITVPTYLRSAAASTGTINAAAAPTLAMDPYTPAGSVSVNVSSGTDTAVSVAGVTVLTPPLADAGSSFTGTPATLTGSVSATGQPRNMDAVAFYRL